MKYRISKSTLGKLPKEVAESIKDIQSHYSDHTSKAYFSSFSLIHQNEGFRYYHGEGEYITYLYNDKQVSMKSMDENTPNGTSIAYGPKCPIGTVIIVVSYYQGFYMTIYNIGYKGITA